MIVLSINIKMPIPTSVLAGSEGGCAGGEVLRNFILYTEGSGSTSHLTARMEKKFARNGLLTTNRPEDQTSIIAVGSQNVSTVCTIPWFAAGNETELAIAR